MSRQETERRSGGQHGERQRRGDPLNTGSEPCFIVTWVCLSAWLLQYKSVKVAKKSAYVCASMWKVWDIRCCAFAAHVFLVLQKTCDETVHNITMSVCVCFLSAHGQVRWYEMSLQNCLRLYLFNETAEVRQVNTHKLLLIQTADKTETAELWNRKWGGSACTCWRKESGYELQSPHSHCASLFVVRT